MDNISFKLYTGDILGIIGPNGARNTTLFRCILGIEYEYYGNILIFNKDIRKNKNVFQKIGYVLDGVSTIANNVVFINRKMFFHDNTQNFSKIAMTYFLTFSPASNMIILGVTFQKKIAMTIILQINLI